MPSTGIGETLRQAREARRLSLADAERLTKIRGAHLAALEEERFEALPPRPYAKGFVRVYARLLGLDAEALVAAVESRLPPEVAPPLSRAVEIPLEPAEPPSRWRRILVYAMWIILGVAVYFGYVGYTQFREFVRTGPAPTPAGRPFEDVRATPRPAVVAPLPTATPPATPLPPAPPGAVPGEGVTLVLSTSGTSWIRVVADGERRFQGILDAGEARTWTAARELVIRIGNAAAVELTVNGRALGTLGGPGEVVELRFPETPGEP